MSSRNHNHKWQFAEQVKRLSKRQEEEQGKLYSVENIEDAPIVFMIGEEDWLKFVCECGKTKTVKEK